MSELKPCDHCECAPPFSPRVQSDKTVFWVECPCGMRTAEYRHQSYAIKQWNTRDTSAIEAAVLRRVANNIDGCHSGDVTNQAYFVTLIEKEADRIEKGARDV